MPTWNLIHTKLNNIKDEVIRESKRAIKAKVPKSEAVRLEIRDNLLKYFNELTIILKKYWNSLDEAQKSIGRTIFLTVRDKVGRAFCILDVNFKIPISCTEQIDPLVLDEDCVLETESDDSDDRSSAKMPLSTVEFLNFASKIVPQDFDGAPDKLQSFLDSLELLKNNSEGHEQNAVAFIKTRLSGKARDLITNQNSLDSITTSLKNGIKGENSRVITAKLQNLRQNTKDSVTFSSEISNLADKLKRAYIVEGVPTETANLYTTESVVKALSQNANTEKARIVMEAGSFGTVEEAINKFININPNITGNTNIYHFRGINRGNNNFTRFSRYNNRGRLSNYNGNRNRNQIQNNNYTNNNNHNSRGRGYYWRNNQGRNQRGNLSGSPRHIRQYDVEHDSENQPVPQQDRLGEI